MKSSFWAAVAMAIAIIFAFRVIALEKQLQVDELQWNTTDGEVKALGNQTYQGNETP